MTRIFLAIILILVISGSIVGVFYYVTIHARASPTVTVTYIGVYLISNENINESTPAWLPTDNINILESNATDLYTYEFNVATANLRIVNGVQMNTVLLNSELIPFGSEYGLTIVGNSPVIYIIGPDSNIWCFASDHNNLSTSEIASFTQNLQMAILQAISNP